jgi:hypothetical protein
MLNMSAAGLALVAAVAFAPPLRAQSLPGEGLPVRL